MSYENIVYQEDAGVVTVTLNRLARLNALNIHTIAELEQVVDGVEGDSAVRVVIITGGEKCFSAGADIKEERPPDLLPRVRKLFGKMAASGKPYIAAIAGVALGGGCELALACDLRIAAENARLGFPELKIASLPGFGGTQRLTRLVGPAASKELILLAEPIDAREAYRIGLVNHVVPPGLLMEECRRVARVLAERPAVSVKMAKAAINSATVTDLESGLDKEYECFQVVLASEDHGEGIRAFQEKRKPVFRGK